MKENADINFDFIEAATIVLYARQYILVFGVADALNLRHFIINLEFQLFLASYQKIEFLNSYG